jgi:hypothetical protein
MSPKTVKKLIRYRNILVAIASGVITWIILIIAPLGLFAVILCTIGVTLGSFAMALVGDYLLFNLLEQNNIKLFEKIPQSATLNKDDNLPYRDYPYNLEDETQNRKFPPQ